MNCLDFRRRWLTVPNARDLALTQHERGCTGCRQFARRSSVFESRLREALAIEVPTGLSDRIRQRRDIGEQVRVRQLRPLRYVLAASLALMLAFAAAVGYRFLMPDLHAAGLERSVLRYVSQERTNLKADRVLPRSRVRALFARFGAQLRDELGQVRFAATCELRGFPCAHLVLKGRAGPVNVLYLDGGQYDGILFPVDGGSMAVLGEPGEGIDAVARLLRGNLRWSV